jgi:sporulation protein YlmC with PRC-barrel domain
MQKSNVWSTTALLNERVRNAAGEDIGRIEDMIIDPGSGVVQYALLDTGNRLLTVPWSSLRVSPSHDYLMLGLDRRTLERAPAFDRVHSPDMSDPAWRRRIDDYYGASYPAPAVTEVRRVRPVRQGMSLAAGLLLVCLVLGLGWMTFLVSTRGWDDAKQNVTSSLQTAVHAAKETGQDAALSTKVKTALALSKRIQSNQITVESEGDTVTLRGDVPSSQISEAAESIARDVTGVRDVQNHLFVASPSR